MKMEKSWVMMKDRTDKEHEDVGGSLIYSTSEVRHSGLWSGDWSQLMVGQEWPTRMIECIEKAGLWWDRTGNVEKKTGGALRVVGGLAGLESSSLLSGDRIGRLGGTAIECWHVDCMVSQYYNFSFMRIKSICNQVRRSRAVAPLSPHLFPYFILSWNRQWLVDGETVRLRTVKCRALRRMQQTFTFDKIMDWQQHGRVKGLAVRGVDSENFSPFSICNSANRSAHWYASTRVHTVICRQSAIHI